MEEQVILRLPENLAGAVALMTEGAANAPTNAGLEPLSDYESFWFVVEQGSSGTVRYPAKLVNLPTLTESHKMAGSQPGSLYKSGEISQVIVVFDVEAQRKEILKEHREQMGMAYGGVGAADDRDIDSLPQDKREMLEQLQALAANPTAVKAEKILPLVKDPTPGSQDMLLDDGLTPPMAHAVRRRFQRAQRFITRFTRDEIAEGERVLLELITRSQGMGSERYSHTVEELVDAEPFMAPWFSGGGDNVTIVYENGVLKDMYQMQSPEGPGKVWTTAESGGEEVGRPVRANPDGTFGNTTAGQSRRAMQAQQQAMAMAAGAGAAGSAATAFGAARKPTAQPAAPAAPTPAVPQGPTVEELADNLVVGAEAEAEEGLAAFADDAEIMFDGFGMGLGGMSGLPMPVGSGGASGGFSGGASMMGGRLGQQSGMPQPTASGLGLGMELGGPSEPSTAGGGGAGDAGGSDAAAAHLARSQWQESVGAQQQAEDEEQEEAEQSNLQPPAAASAPQPPQAAAPVAGMAMTLDDEEDEGATGGEIAAPAAPSAASSSSAVDPLTLPHIQPLVAAVRAAEAKAREARDALAGSEKRLNDASLPALKKRWEGDVNAKRGALAQAEAALATAQSALDEAVRAAGV